MGHGNFKTICTCLLALTLAHPGIGQEPLTNPREALMLRRITEYWRDGDYASAKRQILEFLEKNPQSTLRDPLSAMLGDLYFQEREYRQAFATYDLILDPDVRAKTFFNNLQAHFEMKDYPWVIEKAENELRLNKGTDKQLETKVRYMLAEAAFREALQSKEADQRLTFLKIAKPHFKILTQTEFGDRALFPLAEIHRLLKEDGRASDLYMQLADKYPVHRERFLFQAAIMQINENKKEAVKIFHKVYELGGKRARLAAFNELILLYQNKQYDQYIALYPKVIEHIPNEKAVLLQFYEGSSFYSLGAMEQAVTALEAFVESKPARSKEFKTALLLLVNCSQQLKDPALLERTMYSFKTSFPKDTEFSKILFAHSQMCREGGNFAGALHDLKLLTSDFPQFEEAEMVLYDMGLILEQTEQLQEARETFLSFIEKYPGSQRFNAAWRHLINCSIEDLSNPANPRSTESKESFVRVLDTALKKKDLLNEKERTQYTLVQIKYLCELAKYHEAIPLLGQFIADTLEEDYQAEANLLMAICKQKVGADSDQFIAYAERALQLRPNLADSEVLHLELYNAYLGIAQKEEELEYRDIALCNAADHLYDSGAWKTGSIKRENLLWLTNHFYERAKNDSDDLPYATSLFNMLLGTGEGMSQLFLTPETVGLEGEVLKYAHLMDIHNQMYEQITLLEALVRKQELQPQLPWKLKRRAILELAKAYENDSQYENALRSYQFLASTGSISSSVIASTAQLHLARLQFGLLSSDKRKADRPEVVSILHKLKDLQIQKRVRSEPVHLEAALEYAEMRGDLSDIDEQASTSIFFLQRMQQDFTSTEDLVTREYNALLERHPDKHALFQAYMQFIDAEVMRWQGQLARKDKDEEYALECEESALALYDNLIENEENLGPYLIERVKRSQAQLARL